MTAAAASDRPTVRIGVFLPSGAQLLDTACVDLFDMMSHEYLSALEKLPRAAADIAPHVWIAYVGTVAAGGPIQLTGGMSVTCTHHLSDPEVGAGRLDVVLVPGPDPRLRWDGEVLGWLRGHANRVRDTDILSVCTGIYICGEAGLLRGRRACGPRGLQKEIGERFEGVTLLGDELRWVSDGNLWSSGGVTNGNDLVAAYARESRHFPGPLVDIATKLADAGERPQKYGASQTGFRIGFAWALLRAWFMGFGRKSKSN
ncbi:class I glutamine amidotransferase-like protein [Phialemonium atrogriseum]|uniref:Class I glutamine amidotransferase-like protein n=1 Tax=Phialemonium atrogriseum TaxID=1093897 RepID=A0AAJ0C408_9PEZI|nr:class I glutamine amidotransferase-like protein [Phialemonium atrogriseum]KAK1769540.1 class I glutamine amidotransferase-like protein [Phialemonium atrogriseum]